MGSNDLKRLVHLARLQFGEETGGKPSMPHKLLKCLSLSVRKKSNWFLRAEEALEAQGDQADAPEASPLREE